MKKQSKKKDAMKYISIPRKLFMFLLSMIFLIGSNVFAEQVHFFTPSSDDLVYNDANENSVLIWDNQVTIPGPRMSSGQSYELDTVKFAVAIDAPHWR